MTKPNTDKSFEAWMARLNRKLSMLIGVDTNDLADQPYYCWWQDGYSIEDAIAELAAEEGFEELL